jgi:hypothetical protein
MMQTCVTQPSMVVSQQDADADDGTAIKQRTANHERKCMSAGAGRRIMPV